VSSLSEATESLASVEDPLTKLQCIRADRVSTGLAPALCEVAGAHIKRRSHVGTVKEP